MFNKHFDIYYISLKQNFINKKVKPTQKQNKKKK